MKEPNYKNNELLQHCTKIGLALPWDKRFVNLTKKDVSGLCSDLDKLHEYFGKLVKNTPLQLRGIHDNAKSQIKEREELEMAMFIACSNVWAALWHVHASFIPQKYLDEVADFEADDNNNGY